MKNRTGIRFGMLVVESFAEKRNGKQYFWNCRCDCGNVKPVNIDSLVSGCTKSCGCLEESSRFGRQKKHGLHGTPEYIALHSLIGRCTNPKNPAFHDYGGRGITVCERWRGPLGVFNFIADMGQKPSKRHSIDRIDNDGNYEPGNCRWATRLQQNRNTRANRFVTHKGQRVLIVELAEMSGLTAAVLRGRLNSGWHIDDAIATPLIKTPPADKRTHCRHGHEIKPENTIKRKGKRAFGFECLECQRIRIRKRRQQ